MKHDIAAIIRKTQAELSPRKRIARNLLVLVEATDQAAQRTRTVLKNTPPGIEEPLEHRIGMITELAQLQVRIEGYRQHLAQLRPKDPMPRQLEPLLLRVNWPLGAPASDRHFTPDFATPFTIENQFEALKAYRKIHWDTFFAFLRDGVVDVAKAAGRVVTETVEAAAEGVAESTGSVWPWVLGGVGIVAFGGTLLYVAHR